MLWFAVLVFGVAKVNSSLLINITQGLVQGSVLTENGVNYNAWYGIPYAGTTAGLNRFKPPTPAPTFTEPFSATERGIVCTQPGPTVGSVIGIEDCLRLSIFTPYNTSSTNITNPVLVWIVGEEYTTSKPIEHSLKAFVEQDLTVVAVNYRLSIFGFLCLGIDDAPGNAGLRDIVQALTWIQNNIRQFGGNPQNVALFGHGSGAALVDLLTMSPLARGLMHRVITQSGSALAPWAVSYDPRGSAFTYARQLGLNTNNVTTLIQFYRAAGQSSLISELNQNTFRNNTVLFAPCIENARLDPNNMILTDAPINLLRNGNYSDIDYLAGYTVREGSIRAGKVAEWIPEMNTNFSQFLPADLNVPSNMTEDVRRFYFNDSSIDYDNADTYLIYHGDTMLLGPIIRGVKERRATSTSGIYLMEFDYIRINEIVYWPYPNIPLKGAPHGALLNILLGINLVTNDFDIQGSLLRRYASFINNGEPVYNNSVAWFPVESNIAYHLVYQGGPYGNVPGLWSSSQMIRSIPAEYSMTFWDSFYSRFYVAPQPVTGSAMVHVGSVLMLFLSAFVALR